MQVVPETGRSLASVVGPRPFAEAALLRADVNIHLGTRFLADMLKRFEEVRLVLAAYNAGPSRATRWREFPEMDDPLRFTERIPFPETRDYVRIVIRNRVLYSWLYH